jgi:hypothetical protein
MAQAELDLEERVLVLGRYLDLISQQLDASADIFAVMERRMDIMKRTMTFEIHLLCEQVRELEVQVERLRWWDHWLLKVYRWWK